MCVRTVSFLVRGSFVPGLIHLTGMEKSMKNQYQNASNISSRINLHSLYSQNKQGWFPWVYEQCQIHPGMRILELGCGDGVLWTQNISSLPGKVSVTLSDLSSGMLRDARRAIGRKDSRFSFEAFDCAEIELYILGSKEMRLIIRIDMTFVSKL